MKTVPNCEWAQRMGKGMLLVSVPRNQRPIARLLQTSLEREFGCTRCVWSVKRRSDVSFETEMITKRGRGCVCGVSSRWHLPTRGSGSVF